MSYTDSENAIIQQISLSPLDDRRKKTVLQFFFQKMQSPTCVINDILPAETASIVCQEYGQVVIKNHLFHSVFIIFKICDTLFI